MKKVEVEGSATESDITVAATVTPVVATAEMVVANARCIWHVQACVGESEESNLVGCPMIEF